MDSPSFNGFHAQLDCKSTYGNKNQTQLTLVQYKVSFSKKTQKKTGKMKNITWHNY